MTKLCLVLSAILYCVLIVLALRPAFDLDGARAFYRGAGHFVGNTPAGIVARYTAWAVPFVVMAGLALAWLGARFGVLRKSLAPSGRSLLFLALSMAVAPGLLVHGVLKEVSHRPRPYNVTEFGGADAFRPFFKFDGACPGNCAFASGETAAATWTLAPASLVPPPWRSPALAAAVVFATATGVWRMAFGAHFLSDVCGAALITILVILTLRSFLMRSRTEADVGRRDQSG